MSNSRSQKSTGQIEVLSTLDDRIFHAFSSPLRRQILASLAQRPNNAVALSGELDAKRQRINYHLSRVLDKKCNLVEVVDKQPASGSWEYTYAVRIDAFLKWLQSPDPTTTALVSAIVAAAKKNLSGANFSFWREVLSELN